MGGSRPDDDGQNSSWRPPGKAEKRSIRSGKPGKASIRAGKAEKGSIRSGKVGRLHWLLFLASTCSTTLADSMHEGEPLDVMMITTDHLLILMMIDWWGHTDTVSISGHIFGGLALTHTFYDNRPETSLTSETSLNLIAEK